MLKFGLNFFFFRIIITKIMVKTASTLNCQQLKHDGNIVQISHICLVSQRLDDAIVIIMIGIISRVKFDQNNNAYVNLMSIRSSKIILIDTQFK